MPDGTNLGGVPSVLFQTLNAIAPTTTWQNQIQQVATPWEGGANLNLAQVPDNGEPLGANGNQQDDPNVGDIRIGAMPLGPGVLAETFLPPPANGGTIAGDIILNSQAAWAVGTTYDLQTVVAHEFGHALGLGESTVQIAEMYGTYNGIKTALASDDISGIRSLYGAPQYDQFNTGGHHDGTFLTAVNITSYIDGNGQIAIPNLDNTTSGQSEWYVVTVPAANSGTMGVMVQSVDLSSFAPAMYIFNSSLQQVTTASTPTTYGSELSVSVPVSAGQKYYIKVLAGGSYGMVGGYGLELNFGSKSQPMIPPPNTVVPQQPNGGGGTAANAQWTTVGNLAGWSIVMTSAQGGGVPNNGGTSGPLSQAPPAGGSSGPLILASTAVTVSAGPAVATGARPTATVAPAPSRGVALQALDLALSGWLTKPRRLIGFPLTNETFV
jgi:hypothetical protein